MKKIHNKFLLIAFLVLAVFAVIIYVIDKRKGERNFRSELFKIDSSAVTAITIYPKGKPNDTVDLVKTGKNWEVKVKNRSYPADTMTIQRILQALVEVKAGRVASAGKEGWKQLDITDSASARVVIHQGRDITADFRLGKISFTRTRMPDYGRNQNIDVKSHIRVSGDDRVYVVDGFLSMMFSDQPSAYRNRTLVRFNKTDLARLTFLYPGDSSFRLIKQGTRWLVNDRPADSAKVETWLNSLANCNGSDFAGDSAEQVNFPYTCRIEGNNMTPIVISGIYEKTVNSYMITSTLNPTAFFSSRPPNLFHLVFPSKNRFTATGIRAEKASLR